MDRYVYFLLGLSLLVPLSAVLLERKDLASKAIKLGMLGGLAGLLAELFHFRDYWRPPSRFGLATISVGYYLPALVTHS